MNKTPNVKWKYYFDYYRAVNYDYLVEDKLNKEQLKTVKNNNAQLLQKQNEQLLSLNLQSYPKPQLVAKKDHRFELTTTYPGLLIGSGYQHELSSEDAMKLGFYFDHTTGLPAIPGSSIKGLLRHAFKENRAFVPFLLATNEQSPVTLKGGKVEALEEEIFAGKDIRHKDREMYLPSSQRDIFYEAVIVGSQHPTGVNSRRTGLFLGNDYITPHINRKKPKMSAFSNPVPLQFLKVLPEVHFCFQFDLKNSVSFPQITWEVKKELFRKILLHLGVGAKTNVGYGQWKKKE